MMLDEATTNAASEAFQIFEGSAYLSGSFSTCGIGVYIYIYLAYDYRYRIIGTLISTA